VFKSGRRFFDTPWQNLNTNLAFNQRKLLEIYIMEFGATFDEKNLDIKITKFQIKAY
jgi:hypothetical protein